MLQVLQQFLSAVSKFFLGILAKQPITPLPTQPTTPTEGEGTKQSSQPKPQPPLQHGPQSPWWDGYFQLTQAYGCTHFNWELHNPNHPSCDFWHDGQDYGLRCGTPIYAGGNFVVAHVDDPAMIASFGVAALGLIAGTPGHAEGDDVWLLHMQDYAVKVGDFVTRGTLLGHSGMRGRATGCHLHFMVTPRGGLYFSSIDPTAWVHMLG